MPCALELFSAAEIDTISLKSVKSQWCNYYEDPIKPVKCWMEEFTTLYNKPGFHFMVTRIAQAGVQFTNSKLSVLKASLSSHWKTEVTFHHMHLHMDWMLATILSLSDATNEILSTSLIWLQDGNAVYIVCHFTTPT